MQSKITNLIRWFGKPKHLVGFLASVLVVGGTSAVVLASIPDASSVIHGCYKSTGTLRVVDSPTQACNNNETALNWNQTGPAGPAGSGGGPVLKDANGQVLGPIIEYGDTYGTVVFVSSINRMVTITSEGYAGRVPYQTYYQSLDCTGQAYTDVADENYKLDLVRLVSGATQMHSIVADNAVPQTMTAESMREAPALGGGCETQPQTLTLVPYTTVSSPFTEPVPLPFKF